MTTADGDKPKAKHRPTGYAWMSSLPVRIRRALCLVLCLVCLSVLLVLLGVYTTTRTESLKVTGYSSGLILAFGSFLGVLGLCLEENRKQLLTAAIVFLSLGNVTSFLCMVIDGVFIVCNMDIRPLKAGRCQFYTSGSSYVYESYYVSVPCRNLRETCSMTVRSGTCYCCDLYDCASGGYLDNYYEFVGVQSCQDVLSLYILIWILTGLNLLAFFMGITTTAVLGSIKDQRSVNRTSDVTMCSPTAPLLMEAHIHTPHHVCPRGSIYFPAAGGPVSSSQCEPPSPHTMESSTAAPCAPLYSLLPYKAQS